MSIWKWTKPEENDYGNEFESVKSKLKIIWWPLKDERWDKFEFS